MRVKDICKKGACKVKWEDVDICGFALLEESKNPLDKRLRDKEFNGCLFDAHLLEDCDAEALGNGPVFLLLENFNYLFSDCQVYLSQVVNSFDSAWYHTDEGTDGMLKPMRIDCQKFHDEVIILILCYEEHIILDEFCDQVPSQLWWNLKCVYPQRQEHLNDVLNIIFIFGLD